MSYFRFVWSGPGYSVASDGVYGMDIMLFFDFCGDLDVRPHPCNNSQSSMMDQVSVRTKDRYCDGSLGEWARSENDSNPTVCEKHLWGFPFLSRLGS